MNATKSKRIFYFDALRALAIISVIIIHIYALFVPLVFRQYGTVPSFQWIYTQFFGNAMRIGVDLFLMLSGALSLGRVWDIKSFLSKRIPRIVEPFLFWGFVLSAVLILLSYFGPYYYIYSFGPVTILKFIYNAYMAISPGFAPYWFFWMILGTYLIMPIFNRWLLHSDLKEAEYFLAIWLVTCLFDFTLKMDFPVKLTYFTSPIGLVVLGYYLRHTERKLLNNPYFNLVLAILPIILMLTVSHMFSSTNTVYNFHRYSFLTAVEVTGVFLLFKNFAKFKINIHGFLKKLIKKAVSVLARYSYGIYLVHSVVLSVFYRTVPYNHMNYNLVVISAFVIVTLVSVLLMDLLNRIPYINRVIGAK